MVTISVVTAILPQLSKYVIDKDLGAFASHIRTALRLVAIITVPGAFFFLAFGKLVGQSLFFGIDAQSATYLGTVLSAFALGLVPLSMSLVGIRALNAFENTRYQFFATLFNNVIAIGVSIAAFFVLDPEDVVIGLAIAFTASYWVSLFATDLLLRRYTRALLLTRELPFYFKVSLSAGAAAGITWYVTRALDLAGNMLNLALVLIATSILYLLFARLTKLEEVGETMKVIFRR